MPTSKRDEAREDRITMEIVVDCYNESEAWSGWWCYLDGKLACPFEAECTRERRASPRIECGRSTSLTRGVIIKTLLQIDRRSDVEYSGSQTQKIDERRAPRQARDHSPRFGNQTLILFGMPAAGHEQAVLGRRVEWLPDMDSNHD